MRAVLTLYLVFATAAGPVLCCCTTSCAFDQLAAAYSPVAERSGKQPGHRCCHPAHGKDARDRHHPDKKSTGPTDETREPTAPVPAHPCPCQAQTRTVAVAANEQSRSNPTGRDFGPAVDPAAGFEVIDLSRLGPSAADSRSLGSTLPFLSSAERLYAHHALRC